MKTLDAFSPYKYINHLDRFIDLAEGKDIIPVMVELDLVNFCNHNCIWCSDPFHSPITVEEDFVKKLLQEFKDIGVKSVLFKGGGESLLHPKITNILKFCKEVGLKVAIISNFSAANKQIIDTIIETCEGVRISLDAVNKEDHDRIHRPKTDKFGFNRIIENISYLIKNRKDKDILVGINFCFDHGNVKKSSEAVELGKKLGVDYVGLRRVLFEERLLKSKISTEDKEDDFISARQLGEKLNISVLVDSFHGQEIKQKLAASSCFASPLSAVVCANKHVYPCCALRYQDKFDFGEIKESFLEVWNGNQRKEVLKQVSTLKCAKLCGYRYNYYNEIIRYLKLSHKPHSDFV